jgi:hypothetical protein
MDREWWNRNATATYSRTPSAASAGCWSEPALSIGGRQTCCRMIAWVQAHGRACDSGLRKGERGGGRGQGRGRARTPGRASVPGGKTAHGTGGAFDVRSAAGNGKAHARGDCHAALASVLGDESARAETE